MFGIIIGVFAGVIGGAIAFGLWSLLPQRLRGARIAVAIIAGIGVGMLASRIQPPPPRAALDAGFEMRLLNSESVGVLARAFKQKYPSDFRRFLRTGDVYRRTEGDDAALHRAESAIVIVGYQRFVYFTDADMVRRMQLWRDEVLSLRDTNPARCLHLYTGGGQALDLLFPEHPDFNRREIELYRAAFNAEPRDHESFTDEEYLERITGLNTRVAAIVGEDVLLLGPAAPLVGNEARFCEVLGELFNQMAVEPEPARLFAEGETRGERQGLRWARD